LKGQTTQKEKGARRKEVKGGKMGREEQRLGGGREKEERWEG
jgi:hypothetical protein